MAQISRKRRNLGSYSDQLLAEEIFVAMTQIKIYKKDIWLSEVLARPSYRLMIQPDISREQIHDILAELQEEQPGQTFTYAKMSCTEVAVIPTLSTEGFYLVDTNIQFAKKGPFSATSPNGYQVRVSEKSNTVDREAVAILAKNNFEYSRFHLDPHIPKEVANCVKSSWAENFYHGKRGDQMIVAESSKGIIGFLQIIHLDAEAFLIDLIAVNRDDRGKGVAQSMISFAASRRSSLKQIRVGTQLANKPSIGLYQQLGFVFEDAQYVFHRHQGIGTER